MNWSDVEPDDAIVSGLSGLTRLIISYDRAKDLVTFFDMRRGSINVAPNPCTEMSEWQTVHRAGEIIAEGKEPES